MAVYLAWQKKHCRRKGSLKDCFSYHEIEVDHLFDTAYCKKRNCFFAGVSCVFLSTWCIHESPNLVWRGPKTTPDADFCVVRSNPLCVLPLRAQFLLKTDSGYPRDAEVTLFTLANSGSSLCFNNHWLHQSPPSPVPGFVVESRVFDENR